MHWRRAIEHEHLHSGIPRRFLKTSRVHLCFPLASWWFERVRPAALSTALSPLHNNINERYGAIYLPSRCCEYTITARYRVRRGYITIIHHYKIQRLRRSLVTTFCVLLCYEITNDGVFFSPPKKRVTPGNRSSFSRNRPR